MGSLRARLNSIKARMTLLMCLVLVVPAGYAVVQAVSAYLAQSERVSASLQRTARLIASYQGGILDQSRLALERIAQLTEGVAVPGDGCVQALTAELQQSGDFATLVIAGPAGRVVCASPPDLIGTSVADRSWFQEVKAGFRFVVSELTTSREGSDVRTIMLAVPVRLAEDRIGSLSAGIRLARFSAVPTTLELPEGAVAYLVDRQGELLVPGRMADPPTALGPDTDALLLYPGTPLATALPGQPRRLFVAEPLLGGRLFVVAGLPAPRWSWVERELVIGIFAPMLMLMLAVLVIWLASEFLINRHIRALASVARAYSRGALEMQPPLAGAPNELRQLGETLAQMAGRIRHRESELTASLEQKDVLLREIHHRVKNNLQIVTSLLNLRARSSASAPARSAMLETQTRIKALALVHRNLYEQDNVQAVELSGFLQELCDLLRESVNADSSAAIEVQAQSVQVSADQAIPMALLVTEAVSNALKHAFPGGRPGKITVSLERRPTEALLTVADNGVGLPDGGSKADANQAEGIGLTLIEMLAKQIGGELAISVAQGTRLSLRFPVADPGAQHSGRQHAA
jgi:two-component sensor histidine kinase